MSAEELTGQARSLYESWRELGLSESAALDAVTESGLIRESTAPADRLEAAFTEMGLTESAARRAAAGRGPVRSAPTVESLPEWEEAVRTAVEIHGMSDGQARGYLRQKVAFGDWAGLRADGGLVEALREYSRLKVGGRITSTSSTPVTESARPGSRPRAVELREAVKWS
ncbi:hypothetical protein [Actinocorallia aurantiaca]|uniref:Uncharacterized protein n=1 Tax=Actinocorallia aurantiaca TaxID=46204 RepID=A0ABN3U8R9_9ACTN